MRKQLLAVTGVAASVLLLAPTQATAAKKTPNIRVITTSVAAPFNLATSRHGLYVADGGLNTVSKVHRDGTLTTIVANAPGTSGVAVSRHGKLAYTTTVDDQTTHVVTASALHIKGRYRTVTAHTLAYERAHNPDHRITYGINHPTQCQRDALGPMVRYRGLKDSHAYSVASYGNKWIVADAAANDLLLVDGNGRIHTLAVLPRQPLLITADAATSLGLDPACFAGVTYNFESVPTDVEVGRDGFLYVTTLPGGPEEPGLGARGSVYRVNPWTGHVRRIATGFSGATNLALGKHGQIYVAELFGGRISVVRRGHAYPYVDLPGAVAVESGRHGALWAGTLDPTFSGPGSIVKISGHHDHGEHVLRNMS